MIKDVFNRSWVKGLCFASLTTMSLAASAAFQVPAVPNPPGDRIYNPWMVTFGVGTSHLSNGTEGALLPISAVQTDSLFSQNQTNHLGFTLSGKRVIPMDNNAYIEHIDIGPSLYYSFNRMNGKVLEFRLPALDNFNNTYKAKNFSAIAEGDVVFNTNMNLHPFVTAGLGAAWIRTQYDDTVELGGDANQEVHLDSKDNVKFTYNLGAGAYFNMSKQWIFGVRYFYQHVGKVETADNSIFAPMEVDANTHNAYLTVTWTNS